MSLTGSALLTGCTVLQAQSSPGEHVLDIVAYPMTVIEPTLGDGRGLSPTSLPGMGRPHEKLELTLLSLDLSSYRSGDPVIYEILIRNVGDTDVTLPWCPDYVPFRNAILEGLDQPVERAGLLDGSLFLEVRDRRGTHKLAWLEPPQGLNGAPEVSGSLEVLRPGEAAWIRTPDVWRASSEELHAITSEPNGIVQARAVLALFRSNQLITSSSGIEVMVENRLRPQ